MYMPTEDQLLIRNMVREFAVEEVAPIAAEIDRKHEFPAATVKRMAELGLFGLATPEEYEGSGGDTISLAMAIEELSRVCASHGCCLSTHVALCIVPIMQFGSEEQKKKYVPDLASGRKLGAFTLTEPAAGTDASAQQTTATLQGDKYILTGSKIFITNGGVADTFIAFAMTDKSKGLKGISAFIVDKKFPGFKVGQKEDKMGICASSTHEIIYDNCEVPKENLLGKEGEGFKIAMQALDCGRIGIGSQALGIAQGALDAAVEYAKTRVQFGKPIAANQGLQWMLADMDLQTDAARQLVYRAAAVRDTGVRYSREAAMAKLFASEAAMFVTTKSVQIHGGIGYTKSYPVERYMRDAKITEIYEGTSEVQRMVIAGNLLA
ncbi:Acyl-CoA dehydrogenase, short-chain specific [uncultured delta proteobacterium]|uniref:Acyl-CoA dehydrogenase, short-chain specific n=1 Tax=uncultured delta proteobacterium TaxID=34034 RepID=A0A212JA66_9DELT|nr:Acyl-CoA dehydrogenase, short-chain specific [uncultured delta proteobacterium]